MKLYYSPGACSLADHIALLEGGVQADLVKVDLKAHRTEAGEDFYAINPKGYVPALVLDSGEMVTENAAILDWIGDQARALRPEGPLGRTRVLEAVAFISTEIHKGFKPFFAGGSDEDKAKAGETIAKRIGYLADSMKGDYLFGSAFSVADAYLFVMLLWAAKFDIALPDGAVAYRDRVRARPAVAAALTAEGLS